MASQPQRPNRLLDWYDKIPEWAKGVLFAGATAGGATYARHLRGIKNSPLKRTVGKILLSFFLGGLSFLVYSGTPQDSVIRFGIKIGLACGLFPEFMYLGLEIALHHSRRAKMGRNDEA